MPVQSLRSGSERYLSWISPPILPYSYHQGKLSHFAFPPLAPQWASSPALMPSGLAHPKFLKPGLAPHCCPGKVPGLLSCEGHSQFCHSHDSRASDPICHRCQGTRDGRSASRQEARLALLCSDPHPGPALCAVHKKQQETRIGEGTSLHLAPHPLTPPSSPPSPSYPFSLQG